MPHIPPIPHIPAAHAIGSGLLGASTMIASVVKNIAAADTAFSNDTLSTFAGSMIPAWSIFLNSPVLASNPKLKSFCALIASTTQSPL